MSGKYHKVAVLMGGGSSESGISLMTGAAVAAGLREAGYDAAEVVADGGNAFTLPRGTEAVFIALHGEFGEDGGAQAALEALGVPYTGSRAESSRVSFDKILARAAFETAGVPVARGAVFKSCDAGAAEAPFDFPLVVKPPRQGSSVGVTIARDAAGFAAGMAEAARHGGEILVEEFIAGREWTAPVLGRRVLPLVEVAPQLDGGWYSFNAKYNSGGTTAYSFPGERPSDAEAAAEAERLALLAFDAVGARTVARVDFRVAPDGAVYALELNSIPGCTRTSILPMSAAKAGVPFPELCALIMEDAA